MKLRRVSFSDWRLLDVAWASAVALLAIGMLLAARTEIAYRVQAARQAEVQGDILAASVSAALSFDDRKAMAEYLKALRADRRVAAAGVYDAQGRLVAMFHSPNWRPPPARVGPPGGVYRAGQVSVVRPVDEQGQQLGFVYLETLPEPWSEVAGRHAALALLTLMAFLLLLVVTQAARRLQTRAAELSQANARLREEMAARGKAEAALRQSQKMEALGQLTGGIAHDFNNLLQVIHGAFELIRRKPQDPEKVASWAQNGLTAAERGASLTRQLLAFSRSQRLELRPFVAADLIADMRELLVRTLGPGIELRLELDQDRTPVLSDRTQLELAVLNLAINARDAMPEGGRLTISTRLRRVEPGHPVLEPDDYVELQASDTGTGMSPDVLERAFDPFFTTKGVGRGTGLGLSQVYGVARQAGGEAHIESRPGEGTRVTLLLRRSRGPTEAAPEREAAPPPPLAPEDGRTVLVVDDEAQVRALTSEILQLLGYRVLEAASGPAALAVLETAGPDLVLLDFAMPGMNGAEAATEIRRRWPDLPIVFASGYADTAAVEAALGGDAEVLRKPFDMEELAKTIAGAIRPGAAAEPWM